MTCPTRSRFLRRISAATLTALTLVLLAPPVRAVPPMMNYQGYLTDTGGVPRNGTFPMTFALYANPTAGLPLWSESFASVSVSAGVFGVLLGEATPLPWGTLLTGNVMWLETTVDGTTLDPRRPIVSVPYAFRAGVADSAANAGKAIRTLARWAGQLEDLTDNGVLAGRTVSLTKQYSDTGVRVAWSDNFRVLGAGTACRWEILFNGAACANPGPIMFSKYVSDAQNAHEPVGVFGTCFGLPAGIVTITARVGPPSGFPGTDCYTGWQSMSSLEAEEVR